MNTLANLAKSVVAFVEKVAANEPVIVGALPGLVLVIGQFVSELSLAHGAFVAAISAIVAVVRQAVTPASK